MCRGREFSSFSAAVAGNFLKAEIGGCGIADRHATDSSAIRRAIESRRLEKQPRFC